MTDLKPEDRALIERVLGRKRLSKNYAMGLQISQIAALLQAARAEGPCFDQYDDAESVTNENGNSVVDIAVQSRVFSKCEPDTNGGCWLFTGSLDCNGYGKLTVMRNGKKYKAYAHRAAYGLSKARGVHILHKCDVPACCNPSHLMAGTHTDNMRDMLKKGRRKVFTPKRAISVQEKEWIESLLAASRPINEIERLTGRTRKSIWLIRSKLVAAPPSREA